MVGGCAVAAAMSGLARFPALPQSGYASMGPPSLGSSPAIGAKILGDAATAWLRTHPFWEAHGRVGVGIDLMVPAGGGEEACCGGNDGGDLLQFLEMESWEREAATALCPSHAEQQNGEGDGDRKGTSDA